MLRINVGPESKQVGILYSAGFISKYLFPQK
jgi:hypothetical protein